MSRRITILGLILVVVCATVVVLLFSSSTKGISRAEIRARGVYLSVQINFPQPKTVQYRCLLSGGAGVETCARGELQTLQMLLSSANISVDQSCATQIYQGPEVATVSGYIKGQQIYTRISLQNSCLASTYNKLMKFIGQT